MAPPSAPHLGDHDFAGAGGAEAIGGLALDVGEEWDKVRRPAHHPLRRVAGPGSVHVQQDAAVDRGPPHAARIANAVELEHALGP